jgi:predicted RNA-binding Zn ribbon-like protein
LRAVVVRQEAGFSASKAFIAKLNLLLKQHSGVIALQRKGETLGLETAFELEKPNDVWAPIATAVAELLSGVSPVRLRKCEACIVYQQKGFASLAHHEHLWEQDQSRSFSKA